jgi:phosphocarrier protein
MVTRNVAIASHVGLHARPASLFVQAARETGLPIKIAKVGGEPVDAASILTVMSLGVGYGEEVILSTDGEGAEAAIAGLVELLQRDLDQG